MTDAIVGIVGAGVTGRRLATFMLADGRRVAVFDPASSTTSREAVRVGQAADLAAEYLAAGTSVVSVSADVSDVRDLIDLDGHAKHHNAALIVGAAMSPG